MSLDARNLRGRASEMKAERASYASQPQEPAAMDLNTVILLAVVALAIVMVLAVVLWRNKRGSINAELRGPHGLGLKLESKDADHAPAGALIERAESTAGRIAATDRTGQSATVRDSKAHGDVAATVTPVNPPSKKA